MKRQTRAIKLRAEPCKKGTNTTNKKSQIQRNKIMSSQTKSLKTKRINQKNKLTHLIKTINLDLENKVNKKNMNNEPTTWKQDQQQQQQSNREISQKGAQEKHSINVIDLLEQSIKDQQLQEITEKYG